MYEVLPLSVLARTLSVQALLTLRDVEPEVSTYLVAALRTDHYVSVSEAILTQIVEQFPSRVRGDLVKVLVPPHVRDLSIRKCIGVSVSSIQEILTRCSHLERLDVSECDQLMRVQFFQYVLPTTNITSLVAENCKIITDASVKCILKNNPSLKQLNISMCDKITDHAFLLDERLQLSRETNIKVHGHDRHGYLCQLTHIDVSGCRNLTSSGIRFLTTLCGPSLQHVNISYTEVDSTALWYLSGYGLTSAVHMAVSYMMEMSHDDTGGSGEQLAELVKYMREVSLGPDDDLSDDSMNDENSDDDNNDTDARLQISQGADRGSPEIARKTEMGDTESDQESAAVGGSESDQKGNAIGDTEHNQNDTQMYDRTIDRNFSQGVQNADQFREDDITRNIKLQSETLGNLPIVKGHLANVSDSGIVMLDKVERLNELETEAKCEGNGSELGQDMVKDREDVNGSSQGQVDAVTEREEGNSKGAGQGAMKEPEKGSGSNLRRQEVVSREYEGKTIGLAQDKAVSERKEGEWLPSLSCADEAEVFDVELIPLLDVHFHECGWEVHDDDHRRAVTVSLPHIHVQDYASSLEFPHSPQSPQSPKSPHSPPAILFTRCGYGHASESGSSYRPPSGKSSIHEEDDDDDVFDIHTPVNLASGAKVEGDSGAVSRLEMATLATNALVASCSAWQNAQPTASSSVTQPLKPDSSLDFQNDTGTLPKSPKVSKSPKLSSNAKKSVTNLLQIYEPDIKVLDISHIAFNSKQLVQSCLKTFFLRNKHIQQLHLAWKGLTDDILIFIADHAPQLNTISLTECEGVSSSGVSRLVSRCPLLARLNLRGVCYLTDDALTPPPPALTALNVAETNLTPAALATLAQHNGHTLRELDLSWCEELVVDGDVTGLDTLLSATSELHSLLLRHLLPIPPPTLSLLASHCCHLRHLSLSSVGNLLDEHLLSMAAHMPHLQKLDVSWNPMVTDVGVAGILGGCVCLRELCVAGVKQLTSAPLLPIVGERARWRRSQALLHLKRHEARVLGEDEHYSSDEEYDALVLASRSLVYAPALQWLDAEYCDHVQDRHLAELVAVCRGSLRARDYYGQNVIPTPAALLARSRTP